MKQLYLHITLCTLIFVSCNNNKEKTTNIVDDNNTIVDDNETQSTDTLVFHWYDDLCEINGYYLHSQHSKKEIENTYELWQKLTTGLTTDVSVFYPRNIDKIDTSKLTNEYNDLIAYINNIKTVDTRFWKNLKESQKERLKMEYDLKMIRCKAYTDPSALLSNPYIDKDSDCHQYAEDLNAENPQTTLDAWERWAIEAKKKNGNPNYMQEFYNKYNSSDKLLYARIDLITFGWWNCVNQSIDYPDYAELAKEFDKLFIRTEIYNCEEP